MKVQYNKDDDVLMIELNDKKIDFAEQSDDVIVHFSVNREPVLLEVLHAAAFLKRTTRVFPISVRQSFI